MNFLKNIELGENYSVMALQLRVLLELKPDFFYRDSRSIYINMLIVWQTGIS